MRDGIRAIAVAVAALCWALAAHAAFSTRGNSPAAAVFAVVPIVSCVVIVAWRSRWRALSIGVGIGIVATAMLMPPPDALDPAAFYLVEYGGVQIALAALFGLSLRDGGEALVTQLARRVHGPLPAAIERYTRQVTVAWTVFFVAMAGTAMLLFGLAPRAIWSAFVNLGTAPAIALMFIVEYAVRRRRFPWFEHVSIFEGMRAFRRSVAPRASR
ncbi:MAG: hypothetical protein KIT73_16400 [Burkholderiales bacterium]|nr:hypothetical protein [Burkholderiales bacterium]